MRRSPSDMVSLVPETPDGLLPENYVPLLLEKPHLALWDHKTRVVTIDRGSATEFPFTPKVKVAKVSSMVSLCFGEMLKILLSEHLFLWVSDLV